MLRAPCILGKEGVNAVYLDLYYEDINDSSLNKFLNLGKSLEVEGAVRVLLSVQALSGISEGRPEAADAAGRGAKQSRSHGLLQDIRNVLDSMDDVHSHTPGSQDQEDLARYNSLLSVGMPPSFMQRTVDSFPLENRHTRLYANKLQLDSHAAAIINNCKMNQRALLERIRWISSLALCSESALDSQNTK